MPSNITCRRISLSVLVHILLSSVAAFSPLGSHRRSLAYQEVVPFAHTRPRQHALPCLSANSNLPQSHVGDKVTDPSRRKLWNSVAAAVISSSVAWPTPAAHAGLLQFPTSQLKNRYHFMRAGLSELEADDIYASNALFLTNRENCLATNQRGVEQSLVAACQKMKEANQLPTVAYHSLAANGMDTGDFMARTLLLARDRLLPEFTYLDPRGIGLWDGTSYETTRLAIMAMDATEAGPRGTGGRPPANEDGTPNETLADQFVRLRQFLSLQESRTSGENILVIFPDGTGPALASAMIAGLPLGSCHALDYAPGEIRLDVTQRSVLELYNTRKDDPEYLAMLERGQECLQSLRQESSKAGTGTFVNRKDRLAEERRDELDQVYVQQQQLKKEAEQKRQEDLLQARRAEQQQAKEVRERQRLEKQKQQEEREKQKLEKHQQQQERQKQREKVKASSAAVVRPERNVQSEKKSSNLNPLVLGGGLLASAGGLLLANLGNVASPNTTSSLSNGTDLTTVARKKEIANRRANRSKRESDPLPTPTVSSSNGLDTKPLSPSPSSSSTPPSTNTTSSSVDDELESLEEAQERFQATLLAPETSVKASPSSLLSSTAAIEKEESSSVGGNSTVQAELDTLERGQTTMEEYMDFDDAWLRVLTEIRDEED